MPRALWKGTISFGLVSIPVELLPVQKSEGLKFRFLHKKDMKPIQYARVHEGDDKPIPWDEIVRGYEYEKGKYVVLDEKDFQRVDVETIHSVNIFEFVDATDIDPIYFDKPYVLAPTAEGRKAYALLARALEEMKKVGIAKLVIRKREHLAALIPRNGVLVIELMHFAKTIRPIKDIFKPSRVRVSQKELRLAKDLVKQLSSTFTPEEYTDDYKKALMKVIRKKTKGKEKDLPVRKAPEVELENLMDDLRESLVITKKKG